MLLNEAKLLKVAKLHFESPFRLNHFRIICYVDGIVEMTL